MKICYTGLIKKMNISPYVVLKYLKATLQMMLGKQTPEASFDVSEYGLWQVISVSRINKANLYLMFIIPYLWLSTMQMIFFAVITMLSTATGVSAFSIFSIPALIWVLYWLIRIARQQLGVSRFVAFGFLAGKFLIETILNVTAGMSFSLG